MINALYGMQRLAQNVTGIKVPNSGHWIPEERPEFVVNMLNNFFSDAKVKNNCNTWILKYL
jgi:pimeloyl-ACP methyl ester carboxylesterase